MPRRADCIGSLWLDLGHSLVVLIPLPLVSLSRGRGVRYVLEPKVLEAGRCSLFHCSTAGVASTSLCRSSESLSASHTLLSETASISHSTAFQWAHSLSGLFYGICPAQGICTFPALENQHWQTKHMLGQQQQRMPWAWFVGKKNHQSWQPFILATTSFQYSAESQRRLAEGLQKVTKASSPAVGALPYFLSPSPLIVRLKISGGAEPFRSMDKSPNQSGQSTSFQRMGKQLNSASVSASARSTTPSCPGMCS